MARSAYDCGGMRGADHLVASADGVDPHDAGRGFSFPLSGLPWQRTIVVGEQSSRKSKKGHRMICT